MITAGLTIEEFYEEKVYTECPYGYQCDGCWFDCGDDE